MGVKELIALQQKKADRRKLADNNKIKIVSIKDPNVLHVLYIKLLEDHVSLLESVDDAIFRSKKETK